MQKFGTISIRFFFVLNSRYEHFQLSFSFFLAIPSDDSDYLLFIRYTEEFNFLQAKTKIKFNCYSSLILWKIDMNSILHCNEWGKWAEMSHRKSERKI